MLRHKSFNEFFLPYRKNASALLHKVIFFPLAKPLMHSVDKKLPVAFNNHGKKEASQGQSS
jgi:hypothetical protein